jgi:heptosyltransferase-3
LREIKKMNILKRFLNEFLFYKSIRKRNFDLTIDLTSGDRGALVSFLSGAKYRLAYAPRKGLLGKKFLYTHLGQKRANHTLIQNIELLKQFGIENKGEIYTNISIPEDTELFVKKLFEKYNISNKDIVVHIHPTSRWLFKCWKDEYMAEVIKWLAKREIFLIITSSPDKKEREKVEKILSFIPESFNSKIINLCGKINIKQLAAISKASDLFFGIDTAPMHIAAFVGTPVIALFGAGELNWKPWGDGHIVISKNLGNRDRMIREEFIKKNLNSITPDEVIKNFEEILRKLNKW